MAVNLGAKRLGRTERTDRANLTRFPPENTDGRFAADSRLRPHLASSHQYYRAAGVRNGHRHTMAAKRRRFQTVSDRLIQPDGMCVGVSSPSQHRRRAAAHSVRQRRWPASELLAGAGAPKRRQLSEKRFRFRQSQRYTASRYSGHKRIRPRPASAAVLDTVQSHHAKCARPLQHNGCRSGDGV